MSEIRLVRCPKCDKVLPEPPVFTVYQCGGCGAMLRADRKSSESEKLVNSDKGFNKGTEGGKGIKDSGESREVEGVVLHEGNSDMASKSPPRSTFGDGSGIKSTLEGSDLNEFQGGFPKSPMRDRFLNDLSSSPVRSRNVSPSPMKSRNVSPSPIRGRGSGDFDFDGGGQSPARSREVSMSPLREQRGGRSPMSVRTKNYSRSPIREVNGANDRSPAGSLNGNMANPLPRGGDVSGFDESAEKEQEGTWGDCDEPEKEERREKMTPKTSFNAWLSDEKPARESNESGLGRRRKKWKDTVYDDADRISEGKEAGYGNEHGIASEGSVDNLTHRDMRSRGDYVRGYRKAKANVDQQYIESDGDGMIHTNSTVESRRNSGSSIVVDGSSSYRPEFISSYGRSRRSYESPRGPSNVHYMERFEHTQNYKVAGDYSEEEHLRFRKRYMQQYSPDKLMPRSSYYDHGPGLVHEMDAYNHHSLYEDPYAGPMGSEHFRQPQFSRHAMAGCVRGQSLDFDQDSFRSYNNGVYRHYPADWQGHYLPSSFDSRTSTNIPAHQSSSRSMDLQRPGPRTYDPRMSHTAPRERPSHLAPHRVRKVLVASQDKRLCLPIAGGSPFLLCHSCYELLKLPGKFMKKQKNECKLRCGACSSTISFDLRNMSSAVFSSQKKPDTASAVSGSGEVLNDPGRRHRHHHHESFAATSTTVESYDFDEGRNSLQSMESEANESSRGRKLASDYDGGIQGFIPSSRVSKEEPDLDNVGIQSSLSSSSEMPSKIRPPPGSPLREHLDYSGQYHKAEPECAVNYSEKEKQELKNDASQNSSVVGTAVVSETEIDSHGLSNSLSNSEDLPREDNNKDTQPPKSPLWKSPFASRSGHASPVKGEVFVNGQQVPHHLVKKAEQLAGPIKPGDYWYDPKAGFWGVMGHHGLGIIPPSIPEFSFPMPESCSGGNTAVYVNGRELHKSDLDLLVSRGFPTKRNKRYIIDISGEVTEEQSKAFVVRLGKLAPTVEKYKRGFGMHVPDKFKD